jgi:hypothetical protein
MRRLLFLLYLLVAREVANICFEGLLMIRYCRFVHSKVGGEAPLAFVTSLGDLQLEERLADN